MVECTLGWFTTDWGVCPPRNAEGYLSSTFKQEGLRTPTDLVQPGPYNPSPPYVGWHGVFDSQSKEAVYILLAQVSDSEFSLGTAEATA